MSDEDRRVNTYSIDFCHTRNNSDILNIRAWTYILGAMIQFITANKTPKSIEIEKEVREPPAFKVGIFNLAERNSFNVFKDKKKIHAE